jgi:tetratricopeptide (TPR) repeat protein
MTADNWYNLALDLEGVATERATESYGRAITLHPSHVHAHLNLGRLLHEAGEIASTEVHYRQALSANPESALAAFNLEVALEDLGREGEAIEACERALRFELDTASAHYNVSRLYEKRGLTKEALRHLADYNAWSNLSTSGRGSDGPPARGHPFRADRLEPTVPRLRSD